MQLEDNLNNTLVNSITKGNSDFKGLITTKSKNINDPVTGLNINHQIHVIFTIRDYVGALIDALQIFKAEKINITRIESRKSILLDNHYDLLVECYPGDKNIDHAINALKTLTQDIKIIRDDQDHKSKSVPEFPKCVNNLFKYDDLNPPFETDIAVDNPGFSDPEYKARRKYFANLALNYRFGEPLPYIEYTDEETKTWSKVFKGLIKLQSQNACREHNRVMQSMIESCGISEDKIPQLEDVSNFLKSRTGFIIKPSPGKSDSRYFFAGLAYRVFNAAQYIRHPSVPIFSPEPDLIHDVLGHAPLLADPAFAQFVQEIGLASLGASDEYFEKLVSIFLFTVEFGLCKEGTDIKAYGAAILSSVGELEYSLSGKPIIKSFDPHITGDQKCIIENYQAIYFLTDRLDHLYQMFSELKLPSTTSLYNDPQQGMEMIDVLS